MNFHPLRALFLSTLLALCGNAFAQAADADLSDGEVRKVDKDAKSLTLKHGPLKNPDMPGMTMIFPVQDAAMLDRVKTGDKVRFKADMVDGKLMVTTLRVHQ